MNALFKKMNFKDCKELLVLNAPGTFLPVLKEMEVLAEIRTSLAKAKNPDFILVFATTQKEIDTLAPEVVALLEGDQVLWFAYPKGTSKKYACDFNRDTGWKVLGKLGYEGVRMVAIDEDWSALRFRRVEYIRSLNRESTRAMSKEGKKRTGGKQ